MTTKKFLTMTAALAMIGALSACGGAGGGDDDYEPVPLMVGYDAAVVKSKTGLVADTPKHTDHAVDVRGDSHTVIDVDGRVIHATNGGNPMHRFEIDSNGNGNYNDQNDSAYSAPLNSDEQNQAGGLPNGKVSETVIDTINGQEVIRVNIKTLAGSESVFYVPRNANSETYAAGFAQSSDGRNGVHAVYGRRTNDTQMGNVLTSAQNGSVRYRGVGYANVTRSGAESGLFEGSTTANVDFANRSYTTSGTLARDRTQSSGTDTVGYTGNGAFDASGNMTGSMVFTGVDPNGGNVNGSMNGSFYGPSAQTIGATFGGSANNSTIGGHTIMNQDR